MVRAQVIDEDGTVLYTSPPFNWTGKDSITIPPLQVVQQ